MDTKPHPSLSVREDAVFRACKLVVLRKKKNLELRKLKTIRALVDENWPEIQTLLSSLGLPGMANEDVALLLKTLLVDNRFLEGGPGPDEENRHLASESLKHTSDAMDCSSSEDDDLPALNPTNNNRPSVQSLSKVLPQNMPSFASTTPQEQSSIAADGNLEETLERPEQIPHTNSSPGADADCEETRDSLSMHPAEASTTPGNTPLNSNEHPASEQEPINVLTDMPSFAERLPKSTTLRIQMRIQAILEESCYLWTLENFPRICLQNDWECSEDVELHKWVQKVSSQEDVVAILRAKVDGNLQTYLRSFVRLRHAAVHREFFDIPTLMRILDISIIFSATLGKLDGRLTIMEGWLRDALGRAEEEKKVQAEKLKAALAEIRRVIENYNEQRASAQDEVLAYLRESAQVMDDVFYDLGRESGIEGTVSDGLEKSDKSNPKKSVFELKADNETDPVTIAVREDNESFYSSDSIRAMEAIALEESREPIVGQHTKPKNRKWLGIFGY